MTLAAYSDSYQTGVPYLTVDEYKNAPVSVELNNLIPDGDQAAQDGVLANCIARASSHADGMCFPNNSGVLAATVNTDSGYVRSGLDGCYRVFTRQAPLQELVSFSVGQPAVSMDITNAQVLRDEFIVPAGGGATAFLGFGGGRPGVSTYATWTYVSGWANTVLAANATEGATSITVVDPTGFYANRTYLKLYDGGEFDQGTTASPLQCTSVTGSVIGLSEPLAAAHNAGVAVSAFPDTVKQAVILLTNWVIKSRGASALVMESMGPSHMPGEAGSSSDYADAAELLLPFRVVI